MHWLALVFVVINTGSKDVFKLPHPLRKTDHHSHQMSGFKPQPSSSILSLKSTTSSSSSSSRSSLHSIASRTVKNITQSVKKAANNGVKTAVRPFKKIRASLSSRASSVNNQDMCLNLLTACLSQTKRCEHLEESAYESKPKSVLDAPTLDNRSDSEKEENDEEEIGVLSLLLLSGFF
jgi:hypothetical protein